MFVVPEQYRITDHPLLGSDASYGNNGAFLIRHHRITDYYYHCQASDGEGWEHVSISLKKQVQRTGKAYKRLDGPKTNSGAVHQHREIITEFQMVERCPTWEEMCYIKSLFWDKEDVAIQYHPAEKDYVNNHSFCLHLWRPIGQTIPTPDPLLVGIKS
jgi:hypothetical protein